MLSIRAWWFYFYIYSWLLKDRGLNCQSPLKCIFYSMVNIKNYTISDCLTPGERWIQRNCIYGRPTINCMWVSFDSEICTPLTLVVVGRSTLYFWPTWSLYMSGVRNESNFVFRADLKIQDLIKITKGCVEKAGPTFSGVIQAEKSKSTVSSTLHLQLILFFFNIILFLFGCSGFSLLRGFSPFMVIRSYCSCSAQTSHVAEHRLQRA